MRSAFSDYFPGSSPTLIGYTGSQITISNSGNYLTHFVLFIGLMGQSRGSAIYASLSNVKLVIEDCSFIRCVNPSNYGAIYLELSSNSGSILNRVCGFKCQSSSHYQFGFIQVDGMSPNCANLLTIAHCGTPDLQHSSDFWNGNQSHTSCNSSFNQDYRVASFAFGGASMMRSTHMNIFGNYASEHGVILFQGASNNFFQFSNIVNNSQYNINSEGRGVIYNWMNPTTSIDHCIIKECAKYGNRYLFYCESGGSLSISECWLQDNILNNGISQGNCFSVTETFSYMYINTRECQGNSIQMNTASKPEIRIIKELVFVLCLY